MTYSVCYFEGLESNPVTITVNDDGGGGGGGDDDEEFCDTPSFEVEYTIEDSQGENNIKFVDVEHVKGTLYIDGTQSQTYSEITSSTTMPKSEFDTAKTYVVKYRLATGSTSIPDGAFANGSRQFVKYFNTNIGTTSCPIDRIGNGAFSNCTNLTNFTIGSSITSIGNRVFENCTSLDTVSIPYTVERIGLFCFSGCESLKYVAIGDEANLSRLSELGNGCFNLCPSIERIELMCEYPPIISNGEVSSDGSYAFAYSMDRIPRSTYPIIVPCGSVPNYQMNIRPDGNWIDHDGHEGAKWDTGLPCWIGTSSVTDEQNRWKANVELRLGYDGTENYGGAGCQGGGIYVDRGADRVVENVESCGDLIFDVDLRTGQGWQTMIGEYYVFFSTDGARAIAQNCSKVSINGLPSMVGENAIRDGVDQVAWLLSGLTTVALFGWNGGIDEDTLNTGTQTDNRNYKPNIKRIVVNDNITIGERSFCDMNNLTHADITNDSAITTIPAECFKNDTSLTEFDCGNHASTVNWSAFDGCDSLSSVTFGTSCTSVTEFYFLPAALKEIHLKSKLNTSLSVSDFEENWDLKELPDMQPDNFTIYCHGDEVYDYYSTRLSGQHYHLVKI